MSQAGLVKVAMPSHIAAGARLARRVRQILDLRDAAHARVEADFAERLKEALAEEPSVAANGDTLASSEAVSA